MARFINPFTDWGFKHIFGREVCKDLLISFLNGLFEGEFVVTDLSFNNNEQPGSQEKDRGVIFDIFCTTEDGRDIIVEMQNRAQGHFIDRALYYLSRALVNQGRKGEWNYELHPVYAVCFMNFVDASLDPKLRTDLVLADRDTGRVVNRNLRIVYLMLPLFKKEEDECENDFERWIYVLKNMDILERVPFMAKNAVFRKLAEITDLRELPREELEKYDESIRIMRDTYATYTYAVQQGQAKGMAEGRVEGRAEGRAEGEREKALQTARNLVRLGVAGDIIMEATGLGPEELRQIMQDKKD